MYGQVKHTQPYGLRRLCKTFHSIKEQSLRSDNLSTFDFGSAKCRLFEVKFFVSFSFCVLFLDYKTLKIISLVPLIGSAL